MTTGSSAANLVAALLRTGELTANDLQTLLSEQLPADPPPTHSDFLPTVLELCPPASLSTYRTGFNRLVTQYGLLPVSAVNTADLDLLATRVLSDARSAGYRDGTGAVRNLIHASRFFYRCAQRHGHRKDNPAMAVAMPLRRRRIRRALTEAELEDVYRVVGSTGNDPELDLLLLDFHRETAARRAGAVCLMLTDIRLDRPSVVLHEKGGHDREVPVSADLLARVIAFADARGARSRGSAFRYRDGTPLTRRRYNTIFERVQATLPWAASLGVSIHWMRHTTLTDISNAAGGRVAAAYAGHHDRSVTDIYTVPTFEDLVAAHDLVFPAFRCSGG
ncbi:MAG: tyrosine-type recombinase/integrase [Mycobacteriales bacterium]